MLVYNDNMFDIKMRYAKLGDIYQDKALVIKDTPGLAMGLTIVPAWLVSEPRRFEFEFKGQQWFVQVSDRHLTHINMDKRTLYVDMRPHPLPSFTPLKKEELDQALKNLSEIIVIINQRLSEWEPRPEGL